jgi:hypothetical protein
VAGDIDKVKERLGLVPEAFRQTGSIEVLISVMGREVVIRLGFFFGIFVKR